ncbi:hypothetical protein F3Y22_tig00111000pilonHSYRG00027 [Hibiscus syriacus]|uniref:DUF7032 domain-containing protein n=1 Tax=Hibiscus syriacus TaxID=106335 RepID=A0A6A2Z7Y7_HIBSY|nr:uncharacterized protein LOC120149335 [Hibiscus syriacus]KAE8688094.1 hypothetical protein F3Y22_tig00111000pilonHSYRG00027 [Hibiscus syriacus]
MKVPEEDDPISISKRLLVSLSDQIKNIDSFKGKWSLIKSKLSSLQDQLVDLSDFPSSSSTPLAVDLLRSITQTLNDAISLSEKCQPAGLTEGKLKTQSDLDAVLAKLNRHISDSEILIRSGVLQDGAVSTSSSKKEAVRVESRNLITRLQIGTAESKNSAIDSLLGLLQEDDKNVMIAVAQGVVPVLMRLLDSSCFETKEKTVAAISRVSTVESSKHVLIAEGLLLLNHLLRVLESGSGFAKEKACIALQALTFSKENARAIGSRGGISSLLEICQAGTPGSQAFAAGVLRNLTSFNEIKENIIEENGVFVLIGLVSSGTALAQENSIGCLCNLVSSDSNLKLLIVKEGGIKCLKNFMDSSLNPKGLEVALEFIRHLSSVHPIAESLVAGGFIARLVAALNGGASGVRIAAAKAAFELGFSSKTRKELGECGCIAPLIKMLDGKAVEEKEGGAMALSRLMLYAGNKKFFRKDDRGIVSAVMLLDPSIQNLDKKYPVLLLSELVHSKKRRKQMVAAGARVYLQKLVEMNVEGAKKLLESLGKGKIWGVFARP